APRGMTSRPPQSDPESAGALFGHHDRIELPAADVLGAGAAFPDAVAHAAEEVWMPLNEVLGAQYSPRLLVRQPAEDDVAGRRQAAGSGQVRAAAQRPSSPPRLSCPARPVPRPSP